jgi:hypothetical protein
VPRSRAPWTVTAVLVGLTGTLAAFSAWPFVAFISAFIWTSLLVGVAAWSYQEEDSAPWYRPWRVGAVAGVVVLATIGWTELLGLAGFFLVLLVAAFSPPATRGWRRLLGPARHGSTDRQTEPHARPAPPEVAGRKGSGRKGPGRVPAAGPGQGRPVGVHDDEPVVRCPPQPPASMDDEELCWAWRVSFVALQRAPSVTARLQVVQKRQAYLDELDRRNADGLAAWFASGARAAGDPRRYIVEGKGAPPGHAAPGIDPNRLRLT